MIEDGLTDMDDLLKDRIAVLKADRERAKAALERARPQTKFTVSHSAADIERFGILMSEKITTGDISFRRNYLRSIVDGVEVGDNLIRIHGSRASLEQAVIGKEQNENNVRGFIRKWRARHDSNVRPLPSEGSTLSS